MTTMPAISIVSACYNHGRYVPEMIESVLAQSFRSYEIIIVNDGSTDNTRDILEKYYDERLILIHTPNRGPSAARNTAIAAARAPIILNLDADDRIAPTLLEKAYNIFNTHPDLGIVHSEVQFFGARSGRFALPPYSLAAMLSDNVIHSTAFFKKADWKAVGGYSDELICGPEDYDFWLSIVELGRGIYKIPEDLTFYRTYGNPDHCRSGRRKKSRRKTMRGQLIIFRRHERLFRACPEEYERMLKLEIKWKKEPPIVQWLKQVYYSLSCAHGAHWRTRCINRFFR